MKIRWRLLALAAAMTLLTACTAPAVPPADEGEDTRPTDSAEETVPPTFTLAYCRSDSLDPYKMTSRVNRTLCSLLYEGLTVPDATLHPQNALAESVRVSGTAVTAVLRADAVFSDGAAVTAADVVTSFEAAAASDYYAPLLKNVRSATAGEDGRTVSFTLAAADPLAAACLTFPVIRRDEGGGLCGTGTYVFDPAPQLLRNPHAAQETAFSQVRLLDLRDDEELAKGLELGNISCFFSDLADGSLPRVSSATAAVPMNYLVFLGVNAAHTAMAKDGVRRAISLALDRTRLASGAFLGYAAAAAGVFPPAFLNAEENVTRLATEADRTAAMAALSSAGYAASGTVTTAAGAKPPERLTLSLLVDNENDFKLTVADMVKEQLEAVGITVIVTALSYKDYLVALKYGRYDLYVGEVRLTDNLDLSPLLTTNGAAAYGLSKSNAAVKSYAAFRAGEATLSVFTETFAASLPFVPVCWRCGMAAYDRRLAHVEPTAGDPYAGLENWKWIE